MLARRVLGLRPAILGTLVDLPRTIARSACVFQAAGVAERVTTVGQSFFEPLPAGADIYLLRGILNDWPDQEARAILQRCARQPAPPAASWCSKASCPIKRLSGLQRSRWYCLEASGAVWPRSESSRVRPAWSWCRLSSKHRATLSPSFAQSTDTCIGTELLPGEVWRGLQPPNLPKWWVRGQRTAHPSQIC